MITALDVGGMSIRSGLVHSDGTVESVSAHPVDHRASAPELIGALRAAIERCRPDDGRRVAIAVPGPFDEHAGVSAMTHKFAAIEGMPLMPALCDHEPATDLDIRFVNDAAAAGAGEVWAARAEGRTEPTLVLTLGTGMGSSMFVDGLLVRTVDDIEIAALWQWPVAPDATADERFSATGLAASLGVEPRDLPAASVDADSTETIDAWAIELGAFVDQLRPRLGFERVILGGGAAGAFERFAPALRGATDVAVGQARLGSRGPLLGAAVLAFATI